MRLCAEPDRIDPCFFRIAFRAVENRAGRQGAGSTCDSRVPEELGGGSRHSSVLVLIVLAAIFAPLLTSYNPNAVSVLNIRQGPGAGHLLGTDGAGRDVWARLLYGAPDDPGRSAVGRRRRGRPRHRERPGGRILRKVVRVGGLLVIPC